MRKTAQTLDEQRNEIKSTYRRGQRVERRISSPDKLSAVELAQKKEYAANLKAADFSYTYIAEALGLSKSVIAHWFEEPDLQKRAAEIREDHVAGGVKLLRTYAIELVEMLVQIARTTPDDKVALQAINDGLDRMGITKVNKSEAASSIVTRSEVDLTDSHGLIEKLKNADPQAQQAAAEHMTQLLALAAEHTDAEVTHA